MPTSKKIILAVAIIGVLVVAGFLAFEFPLFSGRQIQNLQPASNSNEAANQESAVQEPTGKITDLVDLMEKGLYEEAAVVYQEDQDVNTVTSDSDEINNMASSTDGAGAQ